MNEAPISLIMLSSSTIRKNESSKTPSIDLEFTAALFFFLKSWSWFKKWKTQRMVCYLYGNDIYRRRKNKKKITEFIIAKMF